VLQQAEQVVPGVAGSLVNAALPIFVSWLRLFLRCTSNGGASSRIQR
jgi:hypothetical protein